MAGSAGKLNPDNEIVSFVGCVKYLAVSAKPNAMRFRPNFVPCRLNTLGKFEGNLLLHALSSQQDHGLINETAEITTQNLGTAMPNRQLIAALLSILLLVGGSAEGFASVASAIQNNVVECNRTVHVEAGKMGWDEPDMPTDCNSLQQATCCLSSAQRSTNRI